MIAGVPLTLAAVLSGMLALQDLERVRRYESAPAAAATLAPAAEAVGRASAPRDLLAATPLFGTPGVPAAVPTAAPTAVRVTAVEGLPASRSDFRLYGVIDVPAPHASRAIVGVDDSSQVAVRAGEHTPDGSLVVAIKPRGLVLERAGQREWLALPVESAASGPAPTVRRRFMPRPVPRMRPMAAASAAPSPAS